MTTNQLVRRAPAMAMGSLEDPSELGRVLAASGYFSDVREAAQAVVKVLAGAELGFGPIASMTGIYIVKGRVTISANLMAATIKRHPKYDYGIREHTDARAVVAFMDATRSCSVCDGAGRIERKRCEECVGTGLLAMGTSEFSMDDARRAGLAGGENWKKYPANMLFARAMSNGAKWWCPDAFSGAPVYTPDELGAEVDGETGEVFPGDVVEPAAPVAALTTPPPVPPSGAPSNAPSDTANRPDDAPENAAPSAPAADRPARADEPTARAEAEVAAESGADPRADLAHLLERLKAPGTFLPMAMISYGAASIDDLTDAQAREIMGTALQRYGGDAA